MTAPAPAAELPEEERGWTEGEALEALYARWGLPADTLRLVRGAWAVDASQRPYGVRYQVDELTGRAGAMWTPRLALVLLVRRRR